MSFNSSSLTLRKISLSLAVVAVLIATVAGVKAFGHSNNAVSFGAASLSGGQTIPTATSSTATQGQAADTVTAPASVTAPTPVASKPSNSPGAVDENSLKAEQCKGVIDSAREASTTYDQMFNDGWKSWNTTYVGDYNSPAAQASMQQSKDYVKQQFSSFISANNAAYVQYCGAGPGSVADVMTQPDYDAWQ